jgi:hypothetical protein
LTNKYIKDMPRKDKKTVMDVYFQVTPAYTVRQEVYNGADYLVVPVVMMVEGVHSGSHGPILHLAEELGRIPESWDHIPVTIGHPQVNGQYVSANSPEVLTDWAVGLIFNTHMEGDSLRAEAWIEVSRIQALSAETLTKINNNEIIEVSVGVFSDEERVEGIHGNESYTAIARNHRPNHLALLPDEVGACSIADGCGLRVNKKGGMKVPEKTLVVNEENLQNVLKELSAKGFSINQVGFLERANKAQRLLDSMDGDGRIHWLDEILSETELVYRVDIRQDDGTRMTKYFRQNYIIKADGNIELIGEPVEVKKEVTYTPIPQVNRKSARTNFNNSKKKEVEVMAEKCTECVKEAVNNLINNKKLAYSEDQRGWLETLSEEQLEMMAPEVKKEPVVNTAVTEKPEKLTTESVLSVLKDATEEQFLAAMPETMRKNHVTATALQANVKAALVKEIMDNTTEGVWTTEALEGMEIDTLKSVHKSAGIPAVDELSYAGQGDPKIVVNEGEGEALLPFAVEVETK